MAAIINSSEECQNVQSVVVSPDGGLINPHHELPSTISHIQAPDMMKSKTCLDMYKVGNNNNNNEPCILDVDIEKGNAEIYKSHEELLTNLKSDDSFLRSLQRENWLQIGEKFMQLLMKHGTELPKFNSRDKIVTATSPNRSRKYKRSQSFNSRRVVLMFSILSSMGTMILIYLTLRVRQISDGSGNI